MTQSATFGAVPTGLGAQVRQDFNLADQAAATEHEGAFAPSVTWPFMRWRNDAGKLLRRRNAGNSGWEIIENYGAIADPTVNDDAADGYVRGAVWINVAAGRLMTPLPEIRVPRTGYVAVIPRQADAGNLLVGFVDWLAGEAAGAAPVSDRPAASGRSRRSPHR